MNDMRSAAACPNCEGTGEALAPKVMHVEGASPICPACGGTGLAGLEAAAKAADPLEMFEAADGQPGIRPREPLDIARAVVTAWLAEIERTE